MKSYLISYELNTRHGDYQPFFDKMQNLGKSWFNCVASIHIIKSDLTANDICAILNEYLYKNDKILVAHLSGHAAWRGLEYDCSQWLNDRL